MLANVVHDDEILEWLLSIGVIIVLICFEVLVPFFPPLALNSDDSLVTEIIENSCFFIDSPNRLSVTE